MSDDLLSNSNILMYQTEDGHTQIDVRLEQETVWLTQASMAQLYQSTKQNISLHLKNIFEDQELEEHSVVKEYLTTASDGKNYKTKYYNLEAILSVGYRVRSHRGIQFRTWATRMLKEYLVKGFALDDTRLKEGRNLGAVSKEVATQLACNEYEKFWVQRVKNDDLLEDDFERFVKRVEREKM